MSRSPLILVLLFAGCTVDEPPGGTSGALERCPDGIEPGAACDADDEYACATEDGDVYCRCERSDETMEGRLVCDRGMEPPPVDRCEDHVRTGEACDPDGPAECVHVCDGATLCRCVPTSDREDCGHVWICEDDEPPPPDVCDEEALRRCVEEGMAICTREDGTTCFCSSEPGGEVRFECEGEPPPDPEGCTDEDVLRCERGEPVECVSSDGTRCWCEGSMDGGMEGGRLVCEGPPPPDDRCTDEHAARCAAGEPVMCIGEDGSACYCAEDAGMGGGLVCEGGGGGDPSECTMEDLERCRWGEMVECRWGERICRCSPDGGVHCE